VTANTQLLFIVSYPGSEPYLYQEQGNETYVGIIPDILEELIKTKKMHVRFVSNSRKRSEEYLYQGKADLMLISEFWLRQPDKLIWSVPIHQHRSFLYKSDKFPINFLLNNIDKGTSICTRKGFLYPNLDIHFNNKNLIRVDSTSQTTSLKMLFKKRCDLAVMSEYNALTIMKSSDFTNNKLYKSVTPSSVVPLNIVLRPELIHTKEILDNHLKKLIANGELDRIIKKYIY